MIEHEESRLSRIRKLRDRLKENLEGVAILEDHLPVEDVNFEPLTLGDARLIYSALWLADFHLREKAGDADEAPRAHVLR